MRSKFAFAAFGLMALLEFASLGASAQAPANVYVAAKGANALSYTTLGYPVYSTVTEAVGNAMASAAAVYAHYEVLVDWNNAAPWVESIDIYADANITISGVRGPLDDTLPKRPQDIILESPSTALPVINIVPSLGWMSWASNLIVEGLTLTGGSTGFHAKYPAWITLNRLYIRDNAGSGVLSEDGAYVGAINCSIVRNGGDGVEVGPTGFALANFCTMYQNGRSGVHVDSSAFGYAYVVNSIVYQNVQSGLEWTAFATPFFSANDVYDNGVSGATSDPDNYVNAMADPDSLREDPILWPEGGAEPTPWIGALLASRCIYGIYGIYDMYNDTISPVIDMADDWFLFGDMARVDFEGEERPFAFLDPNSKLPDMGADEVTRCGVDFDFPVWTECTINPDSNGVPQPVGKLKLEAGALIVNIEFNRPVPDVSKMKVFMVPQGGAAANPNDRILFTLRALTERTYECKNAATINPADFALLGGIEGHAVFHVAIDNYIYGDASHQLMWEGAIKGHHTIIDTTPPRLAVPVAGFSADELVVVRNPQPELTAAVGAATPGHPVLPGFPGGWLPATVPAPVLFPGVAGDDGLIMPNVYSGPGAQIFTNAGSTSNGINAGLGDNLDLLMTLPFEDPLPTDSAGVELTGRVVSGFPVTNTEPEITTGPSNSISQWEGAAMFATAGASCMYTTSGDNFGFDPASPGGPGDLSHNYNNRQTTGVWEFTENGLPGLGWSNRSYSPATLKFRAKDRAGNITELTKLVEPLQIRWLTEARSKIVPNREGQTIAQASFSVQMDRSNNPPVTDALRPMFTYRFYGAPDKEGPYTAIEAWAGWQQSNIVVPPANLGSQWVLLVTLAADEAGNVEQWPAAIANLDDPLAFAMGGGVNWMRFQIDLSGSNLDTAITPNFWHESLPFAWPQSSVGKQTLGAQAIVPSPPDVGTAYLAGEFRIEMRATVSNRAAQWYLYEGGSTAPTASGIVPDSVTGIAAVLPEYITKRLDDNNPIPQARRAKNWVFTAATFIYTDANSNGLYDSGETITSTDPTPASFAFTVVPQTSLDAYVRNRESIDRQPIKVQEER